MRSDSDKGEEMNIWDILILAIVVLLAVMAVRRLVKNRKSGCSCGCAGCTKDCAARQDEKAKTNE